ncbi:hypothetical protein BDU57DRAFT_517409 [Ampelomyces quisqualis]|uniref:Uncharacterized protein n=1 Tax=Ampelomyces quisqualis TaxID=50730 RepID=A0A6A5QNK9_AMPQU|nr:hypothetical protein BDU57DRAFT_517409 [Ampelomyces quisqualis]
MHDETDRPSCKVWGPCYRDRYNCSIIPYMSCRILALYATPMLCITILLSTNDKIYM